MKNTTPTQAIIASAIFFSICIGSVSNAATLPPDNSLQQFRKSYLKWYAEHKFRQNTFYRYFYSSVPKYYGVDESKTIRYRKQISRCTEAYQKDNNRALLAMVQGIEAVVLRYIDSPALLNAAKQDKNVLYNMGLFHANMGNYELAAAYFNACLQRPSYGDEINALESEEAWESILIFNLALLYSKMGDPETAINHYDLVEPFMAENAALFYNRGLDKMKQHRYGPALKDFETAIKLKGNNIDFHLAAGYAKVALGQHEDARANFKRALRIDRLDLRPSMSLGNICLALNQPRQAISHYQRILKHIDDKNAEALTGLGNAYFDKSEFGAALEYYDKSIKYEPRYYRAYVEKGNALLNMKQYGDAIANFNDAIRLAPDNKRAYNGRGVAQFRLGNYHAAANDFEYADGLDTTFAFSHDAYIARGYNAFFLEKFEEGVGHFIKAITIEPHNPEGFSGRAICLYSLGDLQGALSNLTQAINRDARRGIDLINRGSIYIQLELKYRAKSDFKKAHALLPDNVNANNGQGIALANDGKFEEALSYFNRALILDPSRADIYNNRAECLSEWGIYLVSQELADSASHMFTRALDDMNRAITQSYRVYFIVNRGNIKQRMGDHDGAMADYKEVMTHDDTRVASSAYNNTGVANALSGHCDAAREDFEMALELQPGYVVARLNTSEQERSCDEKEVEWKERWSQYWQRRKLSNKRNRKIKKHNYIETYWYNLPSDLQPLESYRLSHDLAYGETEYTIFFNVYFMYEVEKLPQAKNKERGSVKTANNNKVKPIKFNVDCPSF